LFFDNDGYEDDGYDDDGDGLRIHRRATDNASDGRP
jgi:hypothetical protein